MSHQDLAIRQKQALQNALDYQNFNDIVELHQKHQYDKRKTTAKFFLQFKDQNSSPVLDYQNMNHYISGMAAMKKQLTTNNNH